MVIEQRGSQLVAEVYDRGGATATGTIAGSSFTLAAAGWRSPSPSPAESRGGR